RLHVQMFTMLLFHHFLIISSLSILSWTDSFTEAQPMDGHSVEPLDNNKYRSRVRILWQNPDVKKVELAHVCSGCLISPRHVITAASCVYNRQSKDIRVNITRSQNPDDFQMISIKSMKIYSDWAKNNSTLTRSTDCNDIAILE
ncbi:hypothetical protein QAD02_009343, partial [Eretmocerus hayati]